MKKISSSIIKNYIYNMTLTFLNLLFPLLTFPYVTRIIGADGIGKVTFANSIVNYFLMFASLGIPVYAVREIAKTRNSKLKVNAVFTEIFIINFISTLIFSIIYYILLSNNVLSNNVNDKKLFAIVGIVILLNFINIDWLYQGFEQYKYITLRSLFFKILAFTLLFIMVKNKQDYIVYAALAIIAQSGSSILNIINSKKFVALTFKNINIKNHIKPILIIFLMGLSINVYNNFDSTLLGIKVGPKYVGYYVAAIKINRIVINVINSLGIVLMPRLSYCINNNRKEFEKILDKSFKYILIITIPSCFSLYILSPIIVSIFSGQEFIPAIITMRINIPTILFVVIANFTSLQILLPQKREKEIMYSNIVGAIINVSLNLILIPILKHNGAAISATISELIVTIIQICLCKDYVSKYIFNLKNLNYVIGSFIIYLEILLVFNLNLSNIVTLALSTIVGIITYFLYLFLIKDDFLMFLLKKYF